MTEKLLGMIKDFLDGKCEDIFMFSIYLEDSFCEWYDEIEAENQKIAEYLNEYLPETCAAYDCSDHDEEFTRAIREIYENALKSLEN